MGHISFFEAISKHEAADSGSELGLLESKQHRSEQVLDLALSHTVQDKEKGNQEVQSYSAFK